VCLLAGGLTCLALLLPSPTARAGAWHQEVVAGLTTQLYLPDLPEGRATHGLFVLLHGCLQTAEELRRGGGFEDTAARHSLVLALPAVPEGGVIAGCWDYYGPDHERQRSPHSALLLLVTELLARAELRLDPARVYVAGVSSGGSEALLLGCLAPEVFAGVGSAAAPALGTYSWEIGYLATTVDAVVRRCRELAGDRQEAFSTQLASVLAGEDDAYVTPRYATLNAMALAQILQTDRPMTTREEDLESLPGIEPRSERTIWADGRGDRISLIHAAGLGHAWPAGTGAAGEQDYVAGRGLDYGELLAVFFETNNRRTARDEPGEDAGGPQDDAGGPPDAGIGRDASREDDLGRPRDVGEGLDLEHGPDGAPADAATTTADGELPVDGAPADGTAEGDGSVEVRDAAGRWWDQQPSGLDGPAGWSTPLDRPEPPAGGCACATTDAQVRLSGSLLALGLLGALAVLRRRGSPGRQDQGRSSGQPGRI